MEKTALPHGPSVLIVDFGSQVTQLIARRVREAGVFCEVKPYASVTARQLESERPGAIILSGGPASVLEDGAPTIEKEIFQLGLPVLGICYGQQLMAAVLDGKVEATGKREFGRAEIAAKPSALFDGLADTETVWMSHGDSITEAPDGFEPIAQSPGAPYAAIANDAQRLYGVQFHPEVAHTPNGAKILANFVMKIAGVAPNWTMGAFREQAICNIRAQTGADPKTGKGGAKVICGLSGGVDSSVTAVLIHEAIGSALTCVFVDHGLLRLGEAEQVVSLFRDHYNIPLVYVDTEDEFISELQGVDDPEVKRKIIGRLFIEIFEREANKVDGVKFLAQGTLYPDVIESVSVHDGPSVTIKSHHNVGGLPERMNLTLLEPVRSLFKDEVRALGRELGLTEAFLGRHPFPGPGLAIRCLGSSISKDNLALLRKVDAIYLDEIRKAGLYDDIWQAFAVLLPVRSVGVMGDGRTYEQAIALRAVRSTDGMTADVFPFPMDVLTRAATRIVNETPGVNRVVYDVTSKPPGTIEWE
jgi:GMP synthase (glutamine-hydrolysing)